MEGSVKIGFGLVLAASISLAVSGQAEAQAVNNNQLVGGLVGAVVGGAIGSNVAGRHVQDEGTAIGAVLGGLAGYAIAGNGNNRRYYPNGYSGYYPGGTNGYTLNYPTGYSYAPTTGYGYMQTPNTSYYPYSYSGYGQYQGYTGAPVYYQNNSSYTYSNINPAYPAGGSYGYTYTYSNTQPVIYGQAYPTYSYYGNRQPRVTVYIGTDRYRHYNPRRWRGRRHHRRRGYDYDHDGD